MSLDDLFFPKPDFAAGHSMDTAWYAVDAAGHVALFRTGENGHIPASADTHPHLDDLFQARHPRSEIAADEAMTIEFGFFLYDYGDEYDPIGLYHREVVPPRPVHVDQLPPAVRRGCKLLPMPVRFAAEKRVQPMSYFECHCWGEEDRDVYLDVDGVTVRPVRGREDCFRDFIQRFRDQEPHEAARYRFEGVDDGP